MKNLKLVTFILAAFLLFSCSNNVMETGSLIVNLPEVNSRAVESNDNQNSDYLYLIAYTKVNDADDFDEDDINLDDFNFSYIFGKGGNQVYIENLLQGAWLVYGAAFNADVEDIVKDAVTNCGLQEDYSDEPYLVEKYLDLDLSLIEPVYEGNDVAFVVAGKRDNTIELRLTKN